MQLTHSNKILKAVMSFPKDYLQEKAQNRFYFPDHRAFMKFLHEATSIIPETVLLKYYPKYCHFLYFNRVPKSQAVLFRIKQIKIIANIELKGQFEEKKSAIKKMNQLLKNKRKTTRSLPQVSCCHLNDFPMDMCSLFPNIQNLKVLPLYWPYFNREKSFLTPSLERKILRFYGYFWGCLRSVQHLMISSLSYNLWVILPRLQSSSNRFLSSLKSFRLEIDIPSSAVHKNIPQITFQILLRNQDLLKYVTHLKFSGFGEFHCYGTQVKSILDCCSSLIFLSFPVGKDFSRSDLRHLSLAPLQALQNVRILIVSVDDNWSFIEAFEFPPSLVKLILQVENQFSWTEVWHALYPPQDGEDVTDQSMYESFKKYQILLRFFEKFKQLALLTSLDLSMPLFVHVKELMNNFILPILRAVPKLENFECRFSQVNREINNSFDMSIFLDGIKQLKSFKISQKLYEKENSIKPGDLVTLFNPTKAYSFPNVTSIHIETWISEDFNFKQFLKMLSTDLKELTLKTLYLRSIQSSIQTLKICNIIGRLSSVRINLTITLQLEDFSDLKQLPYPLITAKNVLIIVDFSISDSECQVLDRGMRESFQNTLKKSESKYHVDYTM